MRLTIEDCPHDATEWLKGTLHLKPAGVVYWAFCPKCLRRTLISSQKLNETFVEQLWAFINMIIEQEIDKAADKGVR
jgi:hypothetical protein